MMDVIADNLPISMRSSAMEQHYATSKMLGSLVPLHEEPALQSFRHWRIIDNRFPYDMLFGTCHMLLPIRVVPQHRSLTPEEVDELHEILDGYVEANYNAYFVSTMSKRSIGSHYHIHLLNFHPDRSLVRL